jgi:hypothetical protein
MTSGGFLDFGDAAALIFFSFFLDDKRKKKLIELTL